MAAKSGLKSTFSCLIAVTAVLASPLSAVCGDSPLTSKGNEIGAGSNPAATAAPLLSPGGAIDLPNQKQPSVVVPKIEPFKSKGNEIDGHYVDPLKNNQSILEGVGEQLEISPEKAAAEQQFQSLGNPNMFKTTGKEVGSDVGSSPLSSEQWISEIAKSTLGAPSNLPQGQQQFLLKARIEHREHLSSVPEAYRVGNPIDVKELESKATSNYWRKIPADKTGTWVSENNTIFSTHAMKDIIKDGVKVQENGKVDNRFRNEYAYKKIVVGFQTDAQGNTWTYEGGLTEVIQSNGYLVVDTNFQREILEEAGDKSLIRNTSTRLSVLNGVISEAIQLEQIDVSFQVNADVRRTQCSMKLFDQNGDALSETEGARVWHRVAPFRVVDNYQGHDMRALFVEYLKSHDMAYLAP